MVITCILTVGMLLEFFFHYSLFTCIVFIGPSSAASCQCWPLFHTTATLPNPADKFKAFFLYICGVSDCNLSCFIVNNFQSNLNPKDFFFSRRLSCFCFTLTENMSVLRCLWFQFIAGIFVYFFRRDTCRRRLARSLWKPHKPEWQW